jgi:hypothetical protein
MEKKPLDCQEACTDLTYHELWFLLLSLVGGLGRLTQPETAGRLDKNLAEAFTKDPAHDPPIRHDMTDRECAGILGGLIAGLAQLAPIDQVRNALAWWAETDEPWAQIAQLRQIGAAALGRAAIAAERGDKSTGN